MGDGEHVFHSDARGAGMANRTNIMSARTAIDRFAYDRMTCAIQGRPTLRVRSHDDDHTWDAHCCSHVRYAGVIRDQQLSAFEQRCQTAKRRSPGEIDMPLVHLTAYLLCQVPLV